MASSKLAECIKQIKAENANPDKNEHPLAAAIKRFVPLDDDDEEHNPLEFSTWKLLKAFEEDGKGLGLVDEKEKEEHPYGPGVWYPRTHKDNFFFAQKFIELRAARLGTFGVASEEATPDIASPVIGIGSHPEKVQRAPYNIGSKPRNALLRDEEYPLPSDLPVGHDEDEDDDLGNDVDFFNDNDFMADIPEFLIPRKQNDQDWHSARVNPPKKPMLDEGTLVYPPRPNEASNPDAEPFYHVRRRLWEEFDLPPPRALWKARNPAKENVRYDSKVFLVEAPIHGPGVKPPEVKIPALIETKPDGEQVRWNPEASFERRGPGIVVQYSMSDSKGDRAQWRDVKINIKGGELRHLYAGMGIRERVQDPAEADYAFRNENRIVNRLDMTGSQHILRLWSPSFQPDTLVATEYIEKGTLQRNPVTDLVGAWRLLGCLARGISVLSYGSEDPNFQIQGWQPIVHFDLRPENVFCGNASILLRDKMSINVHSCGEEHPGPCYKLGEFGDAAMLPNERVKPENYKQFRRDELLNPQLKYLGRFRLPEQRWELPTTGTVDALYRSTQAAYYGPWSNIYLLGRMLQEDILPHVVDDTGRPPLTDSKYAAFNTPRRWDPAMYEYVGYRDLANRARDATVVEDKRLSRARLERLAQACTRERCEERISVGDLMVEVARGITEAGDRRFAPMPRTWTVEGEERLQGEYATLIEKGMRPVPPPPASNQEKELEDMDWAGPEGKESKNQGESLGWLATGGEDGGRDHDIRRMNLFGYRGPPRPVFEPKTGEQYRFYHPAPEPTPKTREGDFDPRKAAPVPAEPEPEPMQE